jgi:tetratricopeptide (TPR) repeat protein
MKRLYLFIMGTLVFGMLAAAQAQQSSPNFNEQLAKYKDAGEWNLVVIYAKEWVRKEPENAFAWNELSLANLRLNQNEEGLRAAKRALQLSNKDAILWSNLGYAHLALNEPNAALQAFEEAVRWKPKDARAYTEIGFLHLRFNRDREAKYSFEKALEGNAEYSQAICGEGIVAARQRRMKDVATYVKHLKPIDRECADSLEKYLIQGEPLTQSGDFDAFGYPASPRAIVAWKKFSADIDGRCERSGEGWNCTHDRMLLAGKFREAVLSGKLRL